MDIPYNMGFKHSKVISSTDNISTGSWHGYHVATV